MEGRGGGFRKGRELRGLREFFGWAVQAREQNTVNRRCEITEQMKTSKDRRGGTDQERNPHSLGEGGRDDPD